MVPEGWEEKSLSDIAQLTGGSTPSRANKKYWDGNIYWATPTDITALSSSEIYLDKAKSKVTETAVAETALSVLEPGHVLMTSRATLGYAVVNTVPITTNQGFCNFKPSKKILAEYLAYFLRFSKPNIESLAAGSTFKEVSKKSLRGMGIPLPPLPEQKKIAEILSSVDAAIAKTQEVIDQTKKVKDGLLRVLLTRGIGHTKFKKSEIGEIPEGWEVRKLGDLVNIQYGKSPKEVIRKGGKNPIYGTGGITGYTDEYLCQESAILIGRKGTIDKPQFCEGPFWAIDTTYFCTPNKNINLNWLYHYISTLDLKLYNEASGVPSLSRNTLESITISVPTIKEQNEVVEVMSKFITSTENNEFKIKVLNKLKQGLLQDLLTGKVRVTP